MATHLASKALALAPCSLSLMLPTQRMVSRDPALSPQLWSGAATEDGAQGLDATLMGSR